MFEERLMILTQRLHRATSMKRSAAVMATILFAGMAMDLADAGVVDEANWGRLRSMSRQQRQSLAEKLKEFDGLGPEEQKTIRDLDTEIQKLPQQNREEAYSVMRRYHLWLTTLSETDRKELDTLPSNEKMERVRRLFKQQKASSVGDPSDVPSAGFGNHSLYEMATQIKTWFALTPDRKSSLLSMKEFDRVKKLREFHQELRIPGLPRPAMTADGEKFAMDRWQMFQEQLNIPALKKMDDPNNAEFQKKKRRILRQFAENQVLETVEVEKVRSERLTDFAVRMPPWFRAKFDRVSPEAARQQLTLLYRLVFPFPSEIPPLKPAGKPPANGGVPAKGGETKQTPIGPGAPPVLRDTKPPVSTQPF